MQNGGVVLQHLLFLLQKKKMKYEHFTLEDFLMDDAFVRWVHQPNENDLAFWQDWIQQHPEKKEVIRQAHEMLMLMKTDQEKASVHEITTLKNRIAKSTASTSRNEISVIQPMYKTSSIRRSWYWVAASMVLLLMAGALVWNNLPSETIYATGFGETKSIVLPDSSVITLNANSKLTLKDFATGTAREVWLEGEGYFQVRNFSLYPTSSMPARFIVHTNQMNVEVLGTKFNVNSRRGKTKVVLNSGKVKVINKIILSDTIYMDPGEMVAMHEGENKLVKQVVNPYKFIAWKDNQLIFQDTPLEEIAQMLKDNYNYEVEFEAPQLRKETFVGTFPADDVSVLIQTLQKSMRVQVEGQTIIIKK